jgi:hypothetical protein
MPTKHARIALTRDPELDAALRAAQRTLGPDKPAATLARELVLLGAKSLPEDADAELDRWLDERGGVTRATVSRKQRRELLDRIHAMTSDLPPGPSVQEILDELRADRI